MKTYPIEEHDIEDISEFAAKCFQDDEFYKKFHPDIEIRKEIIKKIFANSINICREYGHAFYQKEEQKCVALSLWFDYHKIKESPNKKFEDLFTVSQENEELNQILKQQIKDIENIINQSREYIYLLAIAVDPSSKKRHRATYMVARMLKAYPLYNFLVDISNDNSKGIYKRLEFQHLQKFDKLGLKYYRYLSPHNRKLELP